MRIIFMGTPDFALATLKALYDSKHEIVATVTQPDKPKGRGHKIHFSPVKTFALENNLYLLQPGTLKDENLIETFKSLEPDLFVVAAYGKIIPEKILALPRLFPINVHASLLPKYRGAAPIQHAIINGETVTGITIMKMDKGMDTGDIILQKKCDITPEDTYETLYYRLADLGAKTLIEFLDDLEKGTETNFKKQDDSLATYAPMITKDFCHIDWNKTSSEILNFVRALTPAPGAHTFYKDNIIKIWELSDYPVYGNEDSGKIIAVNNDGFAVKTSDGALLITKLQQQGGKIMSTNDYLKGHKIEIETQLG